MYTIVQNTLLSKLAQYAEEIIGIISLGFEVNRLSSYYILCVHQILKEKEEHNEAVHQLFRGFKKAYDSFRRDILYNIVIIFVFPVQFESQKNKMSD
jgi:hypothetical protein